MCTEYLNNNPKINRKQIKKNIAYSFLGVMFFVFWSTNATATLLTYNGGIAEEAAWQTAAGTTILEDFESYAVGSQLSELLSLGIGFDTLAGGGTPNIYNHHECCVTPYGTKHLGNFPNGINAINRWDDISMYVLGGFEITALGFWNGDGQADTLVASIYDLSNNLLGTIGAFKGTFSGFISDVAISRIIFDGNTGDGWNHLDGLQTNAMRAASPIPIPGTIALFSIGLLGLMMRKMKTWNNVSRYS